MIERLQGAGIPAGAVVNGPELLRDPQLLARDAFVAQDRPWIGVRHYPRQPWVFRNAPATAARRAPTLGEHSREVLTELLGLDGEALDELEATDVIGSLPIAARG